MDAPTVSMDVRHVASGTAVVDIAGEVTSACEPVLMSAYQQISGNDTQRVVLNFSGLEYMNSGGIGMLEEADDQRAVFLKALAMRVVGMLPDIEQASARPRIFPP